jgi:predicted Ser/Thr protein kinase
VIAGASRSLISYLSNAFQAYSFGLKDVIEQVMSYFRRAAQGPEKRKQMIIW